MISLLCSQLKPEEVRDCLSTTKIYNQSANYLTVMHGYTVQTQCYQGCMAIQWLLLKNISNKHRYTLYIHIIITSLMYMCNNFEVYYNYVH